MRKVDGFTCPISLSTIRCVRQLERKKSVWVFSRKCTFRHWLHATPVARTGANSIIYFQKVEMELIRIHFFINSQLFNTQIRKIRVATLWVFIVWVVRKREGSFLGIAVKLRWFLVTVASSFTICRLLYGDLFSMHISRSVFSLFFIIC